jgi:acyl-[acyl carrier protein]--UDP-N-acetylglucosamine O-acyltransferase
MRLFLKALLLTLIVLSSLCGDDSDDSSAIPCVADKKCQPKCARDPDCAYQASGGAGGARNTDGAGGRLTIGFEDGGDNLACPKGNVVLKSAADLNALAGCTAITGDLTVENVALADFKGLETITSIGGSVVVRNNSELKSFAGLNALTEIGRDLNISYDKQLADVGALAELTSIGGDVQIRANVALANLNGLGKLASIGGQLYIRANTALTTLADLAALSVIGGDVQIGQNTALPTCEVKALLDHVRGQGNLRICENLGDNCGSDGCPSVW